MKQKIKPIPVDKHGWLDYKDKVYLIKQDRSGNVANWQWEGCCCRQMSVKGFVHYAFKSDADCFNVDNWYSNPKPITLADILKEATDKLRRIVTLQVEDDDTPKMWGEAYVPVVMNKEKYILTWLNCD